MQNFTTVISQTRQESEFVRKFVWSLYTLTIYTLIYPHHGPEAEITNFWLLHHACLASRLGNTHGSAKKMWALCHPPLSKEAAQWSHAPSKYCLLPRNLVTKSAESLHCFDGSCLRWKCDVYTHIGSHLKLVIGATLLTKKRADGKPVTSPSRLGLEDL